MRIIAFVWFAVMAATPAVTSAAEVENLYSAEVFVSGQGGTERAEALKTALAEVVVKVTGDRKAADHPQLQAMYTRAAEFVQQYFYRPLPEHPLEQLEDSLLPVFTHALQVTFDAQAVNELLRSSGLPVWSRVRPLTLAWIAVQEANGNRFLVGVDAGSEWRLPVLDSAARRGIPLLLPALDLEDRLNVSFADVWADFRSNLTEASRRYQADALLVGRIQQTAGGGWQASWSFHFMEPRGRHQGGDSDRWQADGTNRSAVLAAGVDNAADLLAARFARVFGHAENDTLRLRVNDVNELRDYARVHRYLESLDAVVAVQLVSVEPRSLVFDLSLQSSRGALEQTIALGNVLAIDDFRVTTMPEDASVIGAPVAPEELVYRLLP